MKDDNLDTLYGGKRTKIDLNDRAPLDMFGLSHKGLNQPGIFGRDAQLNPLERYKRDVLNTADRIKSDRSIEDVFQSELMEKGDCGHVLRSAGGPHVCTLCFRDIEEEPDMYGNPGWKCGHNAAPLRDPRTQQARCCRRCTDDKVVPRRQKQMMFMHKFSLATRTPFDAVAFRDAVIEELVFQRKADLVKEVTQAELVVWDSDLIKAALRGADVFEGETLNLKPTAVPTLLVAGGLALILQVTENGATANEIQMSTPRHPITLKRHYTERYTPVSGPEERKFWAQISALFAFMEIEIVKRESAHLPRQTRRALERANKPVPSVTVVKLRRTLREESTGESEVEWKHRWMVRGHWRRQWYPSVGDHKPVYIAPFIKGPEGAPFLAPRDVVKVVDR